MKTYSRPGGLGEVITRKHGNFQSNEFSVSPTGSKKDRLPNTLYILSHVHLGQLAMVEDHETGVVQLKGLGFLDVYRDVKTGLKVVRIDEYDDTALSSKHVAKCARGPYVPKDDAQKARRDRRMARYDHYERKNSDDEDLEEMNKKA